VVVVVVLVIAFVSVVVRLTVSVRFVTPAIAKKYGLELPEYEGVDQVVEVGPGGQKL
jgi:hypothetical protein